MQHYASRIAFHSFRAPPATHKVGVGACASHTQAPLFNFPAFVCAWTGPPPHTHTPRLPTAIDTLKLPSSTAHALFYSTATFGAFCALFRRRRRRRRFSAGTRTCCVRTFPSSFQDTSPGKATAGLFSRAHRVIYFVPLARRRAAAAVAPSRRRHPKNAAPCLWLRVARARMHVR